LKSILKNVIRSKRQSAYNDDESPTPKRPCGTSNPKRPCDTPNTKRPSDQLALSKQTTPKFPSIYTRMSPNSLFSVVERLDYAHYCALEEIGFSGFFWLRVKQLPLQLGYWLVENFDPYRNCIVLPSGGTLQILPEEVQATFGLPMGPKKVELAKSFNESIEFTSIYAKWKSQFDVNETQISVKTLVHHMYDQRVANNDFKVNFVLLVVSLLIRNTQKSVVNVHILKSLCDVNDICNYDWCEYVLSSLRAAKLDWMKSKVNFCGPLLFLIVIHLSSLFIFKSFSVKLICSVYWC
jgi:hypothetical protein